MYDLTATDKRLLAILRQDARTSVTTLAATLNLSRTTVQNRIDRLTSTGVIKRFTVEVDATVDTHLIKAVMSIELEGQLSSSVIAAMRRIKEVGSLHTTNGNWDLVAHIEAYSLAEFDRVLRQVREIRGVLNSETSLLLSSA
ncbi:MAG: Lrp/AsnC family transcriptional regulator [Litoreibacter sp.]